MLAEIRGLVRPGGGSVLAELVELFVAQAERDLDRLRAGAAAEDEAEVSHLAHALKGSSATMGARRVANLCAQLEDAMGDWHRVRAVIERIGEELAAARVALVAAMSDEPPRG